MFQQDKGPDELVRPEYLCAGGESANHSNSKVCNSETKYLPPHQTGNLHMF
jgi:hypothetical protein